MRGRVTECLAVPSGDHPRFQGFVVGLCAGVTLTLVIAMVLITDGSLLRRIGLGVADDLGDDLRRVRGVHAVISELLFDAFGLPRHPRPPRPGPRRSRSTTAPHSGALRRRHRGQPDDYPAVGGLPRPWRPQVLTMTDARPLAGVLVAHRDKRITDEIARR